MLLFGLLRAAEAKDGLAASFGGGEAALEVFFDGELQMGGDFGVEVAIELRTPKEGTDAVK